MDSHHGITLQLSGRCVRGATLITVINQNQAACKPCFRSLLSHSSALFRVATSIRIGHCFMAHEKKKDGKISRADTDHIRRPNYSHFGLQTMGYNKRPAGPTKLNHKRGLTWNKCVRESSPRSGPNPLAMGLGRSS